MNKPTGQFEIRDYLGPLLRRWWLIVIVVVIAAGVTYRHYRHEHKHFSASTLLYVQSSAASAILTGQQNASSARAQATSDLAVLATSYPVAHAAAAALHFKGNPQTLAAKVSASALGSGGKGGNSSSSDFLTITASGPKAKRTVTLANTFARAFIRLQDTQGRQATQSALTIAEAQLRKLPRTTSYTDQRSQLETTIQQLQGLSRTGAGTSIKQINPAVASASSKDPKRNAIFAGVIGLVLAVALILGLDRLDKRVRRVDDLGAAFGVEVIGIVPRIRNPAPITDGRGDLPDRLREPFRRLRTVLSLAAADAPIRTLLVTSAAANEGKSTVARNLALAYQEAGQRVLLIDSDLREPSIDDLLPVSREPGLTDVLIGSQTSADTLQAVSVATRGMDELSQATALDVREMAGVGNGRSSDRAAEHAVLNVLASGRQLPNPLELLATSRMQSVLAHLAEEHDIVIIDTPPLAAVSDAVALMTEVDAVIIVARPGTTRSDAAQNVRNQLRRMPHVRILGVVANRVPAFAMRQKGYGSSKGS